ncbi:hypothetical protein [Spirillospora sp. NPDC048819]|uniref:hypothetical protein n=1 Tax=Spirillospora sp. NPDC048819 TaxID=3155268 RepID=UPI0034062E7A
MTTERREQVGRGTARLLFSVRGRATVVTVAVSALILSLVFVLLMVLARDWTENKVWQTSESTVQRIVYDIVQEKDGQILDRRPGETSMVQIVSPEGRVLEATPALRGRPALGRPEMAQGKLLIDGRRCPDFLDECVWVFGLRVRDSRWGPGVMVIAATPLPSLLKVWVLPLSSR